MRSRTIGTLGGVAIFLGAALAAEAQISVTPTGPTAMYTTDTSETYTATVTCNYDFTFKLWVNQGTTNDYFNVWMINNQGPTYPMTSGSISTSGWNMTAGTQYDYYCQAFETARIAVQAHFYVTVQNPISLAPAGGRTADFACALPPDRRVLGLDLNELPEGDLA